MSKKDQISVRVSPEIIEALERFCASTGISKTQIVNAALTEYLACNSSELIIQRISRLEQLVAKIMEGK